MTRLRTWALAGAIALAPIALAKADDGATVVELFTSQACYSCPPAEAYLGELVRRGGIIALEFHVDYWNSLVFGAAGKWTDPFSSPAFTERQRTYARNIEGGRSYTPQMVIDGRMEAVGSRRGAVEAALASARTTPHATVRVEPVTGRGLSVAVDGGGTPGFVWLVRFIRERTTKVLRGENNGKSLTNHNIVTELSLIGQWDGAPATFSVPAPGLTAEEGCAVLVQARGQGPILGAALCPRLRS